MKKNISTSPEMCTDLFVCLLTHSFPLAAEYDLNDFNVLYVKFYLGDLCLIFAQLILYIFVGLYFPAQFSESLRSGLPNMRS